LLNLKWGFKEDNEYQPLYQLAIQILEMIINYKILLK